MYRCILSLLVFVVMSYRFVLYTGHVTYYLLTYL